MALVSYVCAAYPHARGVKWVSTFCDAEFNVVVFAGGKQEGAAEIWSYNSDKIALEPVEKLKTKFPINPITSNQTAKQMSSYEPDAILVRDIFLAGYAIYAAKKMNIPCYVDVADNYPEVAKTLANLRLGKDLGFHILNQWERHVLRRASGVVVVSPESKAHIIDKHGLDQSKIFVVENVPKDLKAYSAADSGFCGNLVYIGAYDRGIRDLDTAIEGLERYHQRTHERVHLTIYTFHTDRVQSMLRKHGALATFVTVVPAVENSMLHETLRNFDIGVVPHCRCPATEYTVPNKLYDYLYSGLWVICSDNPPFGRILDDTGRGITYSAGDPSSFAESLQRLKSMIEERQGHTNMEQLATKYDWNMQVEPFMTRLHETICRRKLQ